MHAIKRYVRAIQLTDDSEQDVRWLSIMTIVIIKTQSVIELQV